MSAAQVLGLGGLPAARLVPHTVEDFPGAWSRQRQRLARPPTATASSTPPARGAHSSPSAPAAGGARLGHCSPGRHPPAEPARVRTAAPASPSSRRCTRGGTGAAAAARIASPGRGGRRQGRGQACATAGRGQAPRDPRPGARRCRLPPSWVRVRGAHVVGKFRDSKSGRALRGWGGGERAGLPLLPAKAERKKAGGSGGGRGEQAAAT